MSSSPISGAASKPEIHELHKSVITVKVSWSEEVFVIHKELLCYYSTYFEGALSGNFVEAREGVVYLREENVKTFKLFESWLYSKKLLILEEEDTELSQVWDDLVDLYIFADAHGVLQLGNEIVEALIELVSEFRQMPALPTVAAAWYRLPATSPMRDLFVNLYAWEIDAENLVQEELQNLPREFLSSVLMICMRRLPSRLKGEEAPFDRSRCQFHTHRNPEEANLCAEKQEKQAMDGKKPKTKEASSRPSIKLRRSGRPPCPAPNPFRVPTNF